MFALRTERFTAHFKVIVVSVSTRMSGVRSIRERVPRVLITLLNRVAVSNMLRSTTICFDYQNKLKLSQSSCPDGMRLASHDPVCDPSLRKWVTHQQCYPIKCFNVLHIQHMVVQSLCNERQEHDENHSIHCAPSE